MANEESASERAKASATRGIDQVRKATTDYFQFLKDSTTRTPWAGTEQSLKMIEFTEQNLLASFDFADELTQARSFADLARIQAAFVRKQMEAFTEQSKLLNEAGLKATTDLFKLP